MEAKNPELLTLDETVPTKEQLDKIYTLAKRVLDISPWEFMGEPHVLAIQHATDDVSFLIVTGELGSYFSIQVYSSLCDLDMMLRANDANRQDLVDRMFELPQLKLVFSPKAELLPGDREKIKASGITFKNGKNPSIQSLMPGYDLSSAGGKEVERLTVCVEQLLFMLDGNHTIPAIRHPLDPICTRLFKDGRWEQEMKKHSLFKKSAFSVSQELLDQVLKLPKQNMSMACGCFIIPTHFCKKGSRPVMPRAFMLMDSESEYILTMDLLTPEQGKLWDITIALNAMLQQFIKLGARPSQLNINGLLLEKVGKQFCTLMDVAYDDRRFKPLYQAFHDVSSRLGR